jgi:hypothetical protein
MVYIRKFGCDVAEKQRVRVIRILVPTCGNAGKTTEKGRKEQTREISSDD